MSVEGLYVNGVDVGKPDRLVCVQNFCSLLEDPSFIREN